MNSLCDVEPDNLHILLVTIVPFPLPIPLPSSYAARESTLLFVSTHTPTKSVRRNYQCCQLYAFRRRSTLFLLPTPTIF